MSYDGVGPRAVMRSVAFLTAGALAVPLLAGCGSDDEGSRPLAGQDIAPAARAQVTDGGTLRWAVDTMPETLNTFQADADASTTRIAQAVLPAMFRLDAAGRPQRDADYLDSARVVETEPRQVVVYRLNQQAVWSDGREIGAADFAAQWRALSGKDSAYWTARNAGYDRIEKVERGANDLEVRVTFARPYADWQSLFSPLYPKDVTGTANDFNDGARKKLKVSAGPFAVQKIDTAEKEVVLARSPRWWGHPAKLNEIVLHQVARDKRAAALADGTVDVADIDPADADRITLADGAQGSSPFQGPAGGRTAAKALRSWALVHGSDEKAAGRERRALAAGRGTLTTYLRQQDALRGVKVRKSLEPAFTQLALNGAGGPLADERVRHAVAHALDRKELAEIVLKPPRGRPSAWSRSSGSTRASSRSSLRARRASSRQVTSPGRARAGPRGVRVVARAQQNGAGRTRCPWRRGADQIGPPHGEHRPRPVLRCVRFLAGERQLSFGEPGGDPLAGLASALAHRAAEVERVGGEGGADGIQPRRTDWATRSAVCRPRNRPAPVGAASVSRAVAVVAPLAGVQVPVRGAATCREGRTQSGGRLELLPARVGPHLLLADVVRPAAAVDALAAGEQQQGEEGAVDGVGVEQWLVPAP
ncbi:ABC transporter substrate-binding protein [Streptomyces andamanensis]|uniref:ABC transporter substrate-binding protein n=1 Tax=Streptomyces andamanensis TaxID=1565035 RepID=A0ABV8TC30_9ACTN